MLDRLIDFLLSMWERLSPVYVVKEYEQALLFRAGRYKAIKGPGLHLKIPAFDDVDVYAVVTTTLSLPPQSVTTKDGIGVVAKAVVKYRISDLSVFGVQVADQIDALSDTTCGIIMGAVEQVTWEELRTLDIGGQVTKKARAEAKKWGVYVDAVTFTDKAQMRSLRLFTDGLHKDEKG